jgi:hypothetical protein
MLSALFLPCKQITTIQEIMIGLEEVIDIQSQESQQFGTAGPIVNLFQQVWKEEHHVFTAEGINGGVGKSTAKLGHQD